MKPRNWNDTQTYWMRWVVVTTISQQIIVGKLIDVSETDDPVLMIDGGEGHEIPLSQVESIEHYK